VAKPDYDVHVTPSLLDRLIDLDPSSPRDVAPRDAALRRVESLRAFREAVQRDIEHLLNTRSTYHDLSPDYVEAGQSVLTYGLADFSNLNVAGQGDQVRLRQFIEHAIRTFEPRLAGVTISLLPAPKSERVLRMRLDARLLVDPTPEPVSFDLTMPLSTARYEVQESV
jgi:type VI secretion system protein ImpF